MLDTVYMSINTMRSEVCRCCCSSPASRQVSLMHPALCMSSSFKEDRQHDNAGSNKSKTERKKETTEERNLHVQPVAQYLQAAASGGSCKLMFFFSNRWHKAASDAAKQAAKLQAEAKAAAAQCDAASATAEEAKSLARRLDIKTGHLRRSASLVPDQVPNLTSPVLLYVCAGFCCTAVLCARAYQNIKQSAIATIIEENEVSLPTVSAALLCWSELCFTAPLCYVVWWDGVYCTQVRWLSCVLLC